MNIEKAYSNEPGLIQWQRMITVNKKGSIEIEDSYGLTSPLKSLTQTFMTVCNTDITYPGKIVFTTDHGNKILLHYDPTFWNIKKEKMELVTPEDQALKVTWQHKDIYRILLIAKQAPALATIKYIISK